MKRFGIIGYPLSHSFSRKYFLSKFENDGLTNVSYTNYPIKSISEFPALVSKVKDLKGINVTSPYKEDIMKYLDDIDEEAEKIGAVNVVKISKKDKSFFLKGYNTDVYGFLTSLKEALNDNVKSALILGTGGAAKAVAFGLKKLKIDYKFVTGKDNDSRIMLNYNELTKDVMLNSLLIINATPLGIFPETNAKPCIPYKYLSEDHILYDLIYNPAETLFLKEGIKRGTRTVNGLRMLHLQAEKAWDIFNS